MGLISWLKGIFTRKKPTTEAPPSVKIEEPAIQTRKVEDNLHLKETKPTIEKPEIPVKEKIEPKYKTIKQKIKKQLATKKRIEDNLAKDSKLSSINHLIIKRQEFINTSTVTSNYEKLLSGRILGKDPQLMQDIIDNRESILRHRLSATINVRDKKGNTKITFQLQGVLIEELTLIKDYIQEGQYIVLKSGTKGNFRDTTWPALRELLLANNVRGVGEPQIYQWANEDGFIVGNVDMSINYA